MTFKQITTPWLHYDVNNGHPKSMDSELTRSMQHKEYYLQLMQREVDDFNAKDYERGQRQGKSHPNIIQVNNTGSGRH